MSCVDCGAGISGGAKRCRPCWLRQRRRPRMHSSGHLRLWAPDHPIADKAGRVYVHRMVLHDAGVEIPAGHEVHHLNGDKLDNRLENLTVLPAVEHGRHHAYQRGYSTNKYGTFPVREHGANAYNHRGCRCDVCRQANTDRCREAARRRRQRAAA